MKRLFAAAMLMISFSVVGCGFQQLPQAKNKVEAAMAEVNNQYKRRLDLIPNLVNAVKGYASHEKDTLTAVIEARAKATNITLDPTKLDPQKMQQFMDAQAGLSQALGRLMVVAERYPDLKADRNFRELATQLEGTENKIAASRQQAIEAIREMNNLITVPPTSWTNSIYYKYEKMPQWNVSEEERTTIEKVPKAEF